MSILKVFRNNRPIEIECERREGNDKYGLLPERVTVVIEDVEYTVRRIVALTTFGDVKIGTLGGYVETWNNLAKDGSCWLFDENSYAVGSTRIKDSSYIDCCKIVNSIIDGDCDISGRTGEKNLIVDSKVGESGVYGQIDIHSSTIEQCYLGAEKTILMNEATLQKVETEECYEIKLFDCQMDFIKAKGIFRSFGISLPENRPDYLKLFLKEGISSESGDFKDVTSITVPRTHDIDKWWDEADLLKYVGKKEDARQSIEDLLSQSVRK